MKIYIYSNILVKVRHAHLTLNIPKLLRDFRIGKGVDESTCHSILFTVKSNWGYFCERGVSCSIYDLDFCIDTGDYPPVCYRQSNYKFHECNTMNQ